MVHVRKLVSAVEALAWRHGCVTGKEVSYRVEPDGSHVVTITVPPGLVDPESLPKRVEGKPLTWGATTPDIKKST